jgi:hypothetical protein
MGRKRKDPPCADAPSVSAPSSSRTLQVQLILNFGFKAENPCEFCRLNSEGCIMPPKSSSLMKCAACTRRGQPCVHHFHSESEYRSVLDTHSRLSKEIQDLDQSIEALFAKRRRLEKQREFIKERGSTLLLDDRRLEAQQEESGASQPPLVFDDPPQLGENPSRILEPSSQIAADSISPASPDFALASDDLLFAFLEDSHILGSS